MKKHFLVLVIFLVCIFGFALLFKQVGKPSLAESQQVSVTPTPAIQNYVEVTDSLIAGFPDFPIYPKAKIDKSRRMNNATEHLKGYSALWDIEEDVTVPMVISWYQKALARAGWTVDVTPKEDISPLEEGIKAHKGNQVALVNIEQGEGDDASTTEILLNIY